MIPLTRQPVETITSNAAAEVLHHYGYDGGHPAGAFIAALLDAWDKADLINSEKLAVAFPAWGAALALLGPDHGGVDELQTIARNQP